MIGEIQFYSQPNINYQKNVYIGHYYLAPIPFLLEGTISYLKLSYFDKDNFSNNQFVAEKKKIADLNFDNVPSIPELNYQKGEFSPINKYKCRPVIVISEPLPNWTDYENYNGNCAVVIPLYSTKLDSGECRFRQLFLYKIQAYQYPTMFFLPQDDTYNVHEAIARFDRIAVVKTVCLRPKPVALSEDALFCLSKWLQHFFGAELDEILANYQKSASATLTTKYQ